VLSKAKSATQQASEKDTVKYLTKIVEKITKTYGHINIKIEVSSTNGAWLTRGTHGLTIWIGTTDKQKTTLALIHEMGHVYNKALKNKALEESNANEWALGCIEKLFSDNKTIKKLYWRYLLFCLHSGPGEHSQGAKKLLEKLGATIAKTKAGTFKITLPTKYKTWHETPLDLSKMNLK
jgi:hypothetical protein